jgi:hypothetical protein
MAKTVAPNTETQRLDDPHLDVLIRINCPSSELILTSQHSNLQSSRAGFRIEASDFGTLSSTELQIRSSRRQIIDTLGDPDSLNRLASPFVTATPSAASALTLLSGSESTRGGY